MKAPWGVTRAPFGGLVLGALAAAAFALPAGCAKGSDRGTPALALVPANQPVATKPSSSTFDVTLPEPPNGPLAPSLARVVSSDSSNPHAGAMISDVETCASCHTDVAAQWRKSAHAFASFNNPIYRVAVDKLRKDRGEKTSHFCGSCHDVSLLVDGSMLAPIEGTDLRVHAGITCAMCHGIAEARPDGNGSWDLDTTPIPIPKEGDRESNLRHRARVGRATLRTAGMCSTCHKAFLDPDTGNAAHLTGQDDATPWSRSAYAGSDGARIDDAVAEKDCRGCHMPRVAAEFGDPGAKNGTVASHWFLGAHTWLASMQNDPELVERAQRFMKNRVSLDVGGVRHQDGRHEIVASTAIVLTPGEDAVIDVVVRNLDVGHRFPGGVMDAQDTWIEIIVDDAHGRRVAEAGTQHEASGADPTAHTLSSYMARADGSRLMLRETHEFRAGVYNHTIPPRDAAVVGYSFVAPKDAPAYPLRTSVRLRHRTRNLELQRAACADFRSERGRTFNQVGLAKVARAIDACRPQPITDLASTSVVLSGPTATVPARDDESRDVAFQRRYAYGLGLSHALQEHLDAGRAPLAAAIELAATPREKAIAYGGMALVASRQGRTDETFDLAAHADAAAKEAGMAPPPSMQRARAEVLSSTWRLAEAAPLFLDVATRSPRDDAAWAQAAVTFGGAGDAERALDTARRGLVGQPRDGDMLRVQALALSTLRGPAEHEDPGATTDAQLEAAHVAFLDRRTPDEAPGVRGKCSAKVPGCANERVPVHVHAMRSAR
jgi:hypothetical protein